MTNAWSLRACLESLTGECNTCTPWTDYHSLPTGEGSHHFAEYTAFIGRGWHCLTRQTNQTNPEEAGGSL